MANTEGWLCSCCAAITGRRPELAVYEWTGPNGYPVKICARCCAIWRQVGIDDPWLAPRQVVSL